LEEDGDFGRTSGGDGDGGVQGHALLRDVVDMNLIMATVVDATGVGVDLEVALRDAVATRCTLLAFSPVARSSWPVPTTGARRISVEALTQATLDVS
jgi:hypothetical protein